MGDIKQFIRDLLIKPIEDLPIFSKFILFVIVFADIFIGYNDAIGVINNVIPCNLLNYSLNELNSDLISVATTIFTVSGIFISFITLVIQHISDKRGTVIMKLFLKDEVFLKFLAVIVYLSIILLLNAVMKVFNVYLVLII